MNQFHLLRLVIPTIKTTYKMMQHQDKSTSIVKQIAKSALQLKGLDSTESPQLPCLDLHSYEPQFKLKMEDVGAQEEENSDITLEKSLLSSSLGFRKNFIDHRVSSLQYEANAPCEDSIIYEQLNCLDAYTVSVFDGHGGSELAQYCKCKINVFIECYLKEHLKLSQNQSQKEKGQILKKSLIWSYQQLEDTFLEIYQQQLKLGNKKIKSVGTCGITAIVYNEKVYVGNSGDSQGMLIVLDGDNMRSQIINERLSVNNRVQRQKIREKWKDMDNDVITEEPNNVYYLKGRLQPTRTIGDYYLKIKQYFNGQGEFQGPYLTCTPDVNEFPLTKAHKYIVIASDGLWDVLSKKQVMTSMMNGKEIDLNKTYYEQDKEEDFPYIKNTLQTILQRCSEVAGKTVQDLKSIEKGKRRNYHDDITIAVINLQGQL